MVRNSVDTEASDRRQHAGNIFVVKNAILAGLQIGRQAQAADAVAMQRGDVIADSGEHAADLMIAAFGDGQPRADGANRFEDPCGALGC